MEFIIALAMKFWQWTVLIVLVIIGAIINFADKRAKTKLKFSYRELLSFTTIKVCYKRQRLLGRNPRLVIRHT